MRWQIPCTAVVLTLAASAAHAQTVIAPEPAVSAPTAATAVTRPSRTVRTVTTVRTVRPATRRRVVTRRTTVTDRVMPGTTTTVMPAAAGTVATTYPAAPLYSYDYNSDDEYAAPVPYGGPPVYDTVVQVQTPAPVAPAPAVLPAATVAAPVAVGAAVPFYRYVYQPDRILVIDPNTGIAVQAIPR
jgi:hypothetical protein